VESLAARHAADAGASQQQELAADDERFFIRLAPVVDRNLP
jgi:hypothetical protein